MKVRKEIGLCLRTAQVALEIGNLSAWVRKELIAYEEGEDREYLLQKIENYEHILRNIREHGMYWDEEMRTWRFPNASS